MKKCRVTAECGELARAEQILKARLKTRGIVICGSEDGDTLTIDLKLDRNMRHDSFRITGSGTHLTVTGDTPLNVIAGCGSFLRGSTFSASDGIRPSPKRGFTTPDCPFRAVYFANHFHNYYQTAPFGEMTEYIEDMALLGFNVFYFTVPIINLKRLDDEEALYHLKRAAGLFKAAGEIGMYNATTVSTSDTTTEFPPEIKATPVYDPLGRHGNFGNVVCISKKEGRDRIDADNRYVLGYFKSEGVRIDYVGTWPYDEGGCGCSDCAPWGAVGYIRSAKRAIQIAKEFYPECRSIVSTWTFDTPPQGEWDALSESLENEKWCDMILADSHEDFPRYPLDKGVPGGLPLISFPEISMWGLYPWCAYGASLYPHRIAGIWRQTGGVLMGERLYSEGIYEDVNKAVIAGLCADQNKKTEETLAEYARYEIGCPDTDRFVRMTELIEKNLASGSQYAAERSYEAYRISLEIDASLPEWGKHAWRWRILAIRALLDMHRFRGEDLTKNEETLTALNEAADIFHCLKDYDDGLDPYHERVRPVCPR